MNVVAVVIAVVIVALIVVALSIRVVTSMRRVCGSGSGGSLVSGNPA